MSIKKIMHKDRHGSQVSIEFGTDSAQGDSRSSKIIEQFLGGIAIPQLTGVPDFPGEPKGTDTVPAWLTPGEFVMNAEATRMFEPQIEQMNDVGRAVQKAQGGSIPDYRACGGGVKERYHNEGGEVGGEMQEYSNRYKKDDDNSNKNMILELLKSGSGLGSILGGLVLNSLSDKYLAEGGAVLRPEDYKAIESDFAYNQLQDKIVEALQKGATAEDLSVVLNDPTIVEQLAVPVPVGIPKGQEFSVDFEPADIPKGQGVSVDFDYLDSLGLGSVPSQEEIVKKALGMTAVDSLNNPPISIPEPDGPLLKPMGNVAQQMAEQALSRRQEAKAAGYPSQSNIIESLKDIYKPKAWREREALDKEQAVPSLAEEGVMPPVDPYRVEIDVNTINKPELETPKPEITLDEDEAIKIAEEAEKQQRELLGEGDGGKKEDALPPTALDKVKDFFKEGLSSIIDKDKLSEAAVMYLGSRLLGNSHGGSLDYVTKRYASGIEKKLATVDKLTGTAKYTPDSLKKYKDTGDVADLKLKPAWAPVDLPKVFVDKDQRQVKLREYKDANTGVVQWLDQKGKPVDVSEFNTFEDYKSMRNYAMDTLLPQLKEVKSQMESAQGKKKNERLDPTFSPTAVANAMVQYSLDNKMDPGQMTDLLPTVLDGMKALRARSPDVNLEDPQVIKMVLRDLVAQDISPQLKDTLYAGNPNPEQVSTLYNTLSQKGARRGGDQQVVLNNLAIIWRSLSDAERANWEDKAIEGSNAFLTWSIDRLNKQT